MVKKQKVMKKVYCSVEKSFEHLTLIATKILGNSITFIMAFILVFSWWTTNLFTSNNAHQNIGDIIFGITFLSLFIIQKSFNRYAAVMHLKLNELISSNQGANNSVLHTSQKSESEIIEMSREYTEEIIEDVLEKLIEKDKLNLE
jgi:low affinity Fe/Cu permease